MTAAIDAATRRFHEDPAIISRLAGEARQFANLARVTHPAGYEEIDKQIRDGLARASALPPGAEQLLVVERIHADMRLRLDEANAEVERQREAHFRLNQEAKLQAARADQRRQWNDRTVAPMRKAMGGLRQRLEQLEISLSIVTDDGAYLAILSDVEDAFRPAGNTIGLERRAARLREAEKRAAESAEILTDKAA